MHMRDRRLAADGAAPSIAALVMTSASHPHPTAATRPAPLHARLRQALRRRILDGTYAPASRLPSERELIADFGLSRITVRKALGDLQQEGLIHTLQGRGSFVAAPKAFQDLHELRGLAEALAPQGRSLHNRLLDARFGPAPPGVAQRLGLAADAEVGTIRRLRLLDGVPLSVETSHFPAAIARALLQQDLARNDVFRLLEDALGLALGHAELSLEAAAADAALAAALGTAPGTPLLRIERLTHDAQGRPIDFEHLHYRSDGFQIRLQIPRKARAA